MIATASAFATELTATGHLDAAIWLQWSWPVLPLIALIAVTILYLHGWIAARATRPIELPAWRALCFLGGVASLWIAIASPIDALDDVLLTAHMLQHFILMSIAPPLIALGAPVVPLLRGLPRWLVLRPIFTSIWLRRLRRRLMHPAIVWVAMNVAYLGWHVPAAFELTFHSELIHQLEHLCFFSTSLAFWWIVLRPWPSHVRWPRWTIIPYLLSADLANTVLSALLAFSGRVVYPSYAAAPRITTLSPLQDQVAAGCEMWVLNSIVFLIPAVWVTMQVLSPSALKSATTPAPAVR